MQVVLATSAVAETKRLQYWRDAVCDTFVELDCRALSEAPFFGEITTAQCDEMHFSRVRSDGQIVDRTKSRIRRAREEVVLVSVQVQGTGTVAQDGRQAALQPGDFACYDSTRPYTLSFGAQFEQIVLHMPRNAMIRRIGPTEAVTATRVAAESPLGSLVAPFIRNTASIVSEVGAVAAGRLSDVCLGLVTTALGDLSSCPHRNDTPARAALTFRAKAIIERNLGDIHLNTEKVGSPDGHIVALSPGSVSFGEYDGQRMDLVAAAGEGPARSVRSAAGPGIHHANCAGLRIFRPRPFQPPLQGGLCAGRPGNIAACNRQAFNRQVFRRPETPDQPNLNE